LSAPEQATVESADRIAYTRPEMAHDPATGKYCLVNVSMLAEHATIVITTGCPFALLIARHRGVEAHLAQGLAEAAQTLPPEDRAVLERTRTPSAPVSLGAARMSCSWSFMASSLENKVLERGARLSPPRPCH
jgi:hypothetical protein